MFKRIKSKKRWMLLLFVLGLPFLFLSFRASEPQPSSISAEDASRSRAVAKRVMNAFFARTDTLSLILNEQELTALSSAAYHTIPSLQARIAFSERGVYMGISKRVNFAAVKIYINAKCELNAQGQGFALERCRVGSVPLPGGLVAWGTAKSAQLLFGQEAGVTVQQIIEQAKIENRQLVITASKSKNFKRDINNSLKDFVELARSFNQLDRVNPEVVEIYIDHLDAHNRVNNNFVEHLSHVFSLALIRSQEFNPVEENTAALWALAITFGNQRFARMAGVEPDYSVPNFSAVTLRGREDLRLHFLYSVVLQQVGRSGFGLNIGELKEILDTNKGGSGYSFADLAADKAGLKFAEMATLNAASARYLQRAMAGVESEVSFMPQIRDLPEGLSEAEFKKQFGDVRSKRYKSLEAEIDARINNLPLYSLAHQFVH